MTDVQGIPVQDLDMVERANLRTVEDVDQFTKDAVDAYVSVMRRALDTMDVPPLVAVLLYGSRARGDHTVESDADLALILKGGEVGRTLQILEDLREGTFPIEAEFGFMVSPTIIWSELLESPSLSSNPAFYRNVLAEGIAWIY